jgi:hypothetical protein
MNDHKTKCEVDPKLVEIVNGWAEMYTREELYSDEAVDRAWYTAIRWEATGLKDH